MEREWKSQRTVILEGVHDLQYIPVYDRYAGLSSKSRVSLLMGITYYFLHFTARVDLFSTVLHNVAATSSGFN
jgi:hypothetical protein